VHDASRRAPRHGERSEVDLIGSSPHHLDLLSLRSRAADAPNIRAAVRLRQRFYCSGFSFPDHATAPIHRPASAARTRHGPPPAPHLCGKRAHPPPERSAAGPTPALCDDPAPGVLEITTPGGVGWGPCGGGWRTDFPTAAGLGRGA
jgi:hypothetical protein